MGVEFWKKGTAETTRSEKEAVNTTRSALERGTAHIDTRDAAAGEHIIELYRYLRPSLRAYLNSKGLSREHSEDVIQEAFLRLVRHNLKRGTAGNLRAWMFRVAHNLSMDYHRSQKRQQQGVELAAQLALREHVDPAPDPEQMIILEERVRQLREALAQLTPKQRHALLLRAKGLRYQEIALLMGVSVQRVGELMQRAISRVELES
jgi:RNA polymerase sigma-70 factor (ECF subfamily)